MAARLRIGVEDVVDAAWADDGPGWVAVLLRDAASVLALEPDLPLAVGPSAIGAVGPHPRGSATEFEVRASSGAAEDPVTGSLDAALGQWLIGTGRAPASCVAAQGTRLGRRGRVHVEEVDGRVWTGGDTVVGVTGTVAL